MKISVYLTFVIFALFLSDLTYSLSLDRTHRTKKSGRKSENNDKTVSETSSTSGSSTTSTRTVVTSSVQISNTTVVSGPGGIITNTNSTENQDPNDLWEKLFTIPRTTNCEKTRLLMKIINEIRHKTDTVNGASNKFYWVKEWGYGPAAYFFDFLDPVLKTEIVEEFRSIVKAVRNYTNEDSADYRDKLDLNRQMEHADAIAKMQYVKKLKEFNKKINTDYYADSVNSVQLHRAMKDFHWQIFNKYDDYAKEFVLDYDIDGDGRLNSRELILASIRHNKLAFNNPACQNCFKNIIKKLDAMFKFINCAKTGFVDAEQLWASFPKLIRQTSNYNIFSIKNNLSIRTNAINDFVLKNEGAKDGFITKDEFRQGILLGYWDRQTTESGIIEGDSRNLKSLRWSDDGSVDTVAYNYMKETIILELKAKAEERKRNMVNYKKQVVSKTQKTTTDTYSR